MIRKRWRSHHLQSAMCLLVPEEAASRSYLKYEILICLGHTVPAAGFDCSLCIADRFFREPSCC